MKSFLPPGGNKAVGRRKPGKKAEGLPSKPISGVKSVGRPDRPTLGSVGPTVFSTA